MPKSPLAGAMARKFWGQGKGPMGMTYHGHVPCPFCAHVLWHVTCPVSCVLWHVLCPVACPLSLFRTKCSEQHVKNTCSEQHAPNKMLRTDVPNKFVPNKARDRQSPGPASLVHRLCKRLSGSSNGELRLARALCPPSSVHRDQWGSCEAYIHIH